MNYDELSELIDAWVTNHLELMNEDPIKLSHRIGAKLGFFNGMLVSMTDEEREMIAKRLGLKKKAPIINDNGEDSI